MNRETSLLLVIDVQEKLTASIPDVEPVVAAVERLVRAAGRLRVPVCATEHFPASIGGTVNSLKELIGVDRIIEKVHFSAALEERFQSRLQKLNPRQVIVCGTEAHVCVLQTVLTLRSQGFDTFLVSDASASRHASDRDAALLRASQEGVRVVTSEMVLFEWMERADIPEFREVLTLIKSR